MITYDCDGLDVDHTNDELNDLADNLAVEILCRIGCGARMAATFKPGR